MKKSKIYAYSQENSLNKLVRKYQKYGWRLVDQEVEAKIQTLDNGANLISVQKTISTVTNDKSMPRAVSPSKKLLLYAYLGLSLIPTLIYLGLLTSQ